MLKIASRHFFLDTRYRRPWVAILPSDNYQNRRGSFFSPPVAEDSDHQIQIPRYGHAPRRNRLTDVRANFYSTFN